MSTRKVVVGVMGAGLLMFAAGMAWQPPADAAKPAAQPSAEEMEAWMKAATPGPNHDLLNSFAGTWKGALSMWMTPGGEPEKSEGTMTNTMVLGGRYLRQEWSGTMMGEPFEGVGYWGYDNIKKHFVSTWMDSASTGLMLTTGQYDAGKKAFSFSGTMSDPMTGKDCEVREVITVVSDNEHRMEMYGPDPAGKQYKMMQIVYTRTAGAPVQAGQ